MPEKIAARTAVANGAITGAFAQMYNGEACFIADCSKNVPTVERIETLKGAAWALTPGSAAYDCWQAECGMGGWAWAAAGVMPAGSVLRGLGSNPFFRKTGDEIADMLLNKGFVPKGIDPRSGRGTFLNTRTGRSYHLDLAHPPGKAPHVGINRPRNYTGPLGAKDKFLD